MSAIFSYTDSEDQTIDVYFIDGEVGITLPDRLDEQDGPIVWLPIAIAALLAKAITGVEVK